MTKWKFNYHQCFFCCFVDFAQTTNPWEPNVYIFERIEVEELKWANELFSREIAKNALNFSAVVEESRIENELRAITALEIHTIFLLIFAALAVVSLPLYIFIVHTQRR